MTRLRSTFFVAVFLSLAFVVAVPFVRAETEHENESGDDQGRTATTYQLVTVPGSTSVSAPSVPVTTTTPTPQVSTTSTSVSVAQATSSAPIVVQTTPVATPFPWAWTVTRSAGIASFLLLGLLTITGMLLTTGLLYRMFSPATAWSVHRAIASVLLFSVMAHVGSILFDSFLGLHFFDLFIPFISPYRPLLVTLGIGGFYLLLLVLASSLYTMNSYAKFWRTVHFFAFPMFIFIFLHGVLIGTDTKQPWMVALYWGIGVAVAASIMYRMVWKYRNPVLRTTVRRVAGRVR